MTDRNQDMMSFIRENLDVDIKIKNMNSIGKPFGVIQIENIWETGNIMKNK